MNNYLNFIKVCVSGRENGRFVLFMLRVCIELDITFNFKYCTKNFMATFLSFLKFFFENFFRNYILILNKRRALKPNNFSYNFHRINKDRV